jgi:hypothetical protein
MGAGKSTLRFYGLVMLGLGLAFVAMTVHPEESSPGTAGARLGRGDSEALRQEQVQWATYRNQRWGFCIGYPAGWMLREGFDGAGMSASPQPEGGTLGKSVVSAGASANQLVDLTSGPPRTLEQNFEIDLDGLRESHPEHLEVLEERRAKFSDLPALVTVTRWIEPTNDITWVEETLWILKNQVIYAVELKCPRSELRRLEPILKKMTKTLVLHCDPHSAG